MSGLQFLGPDVSVLEGEIVGAAGEANKVLASDDVFLLGRALAGTSGEGAPAKGLEKGAFYTQLEGGKAVALWEGQGAGKDPVQRMGLSGTPADGSVTVNKVAAANVDGAAGTPGLRSLATLIAAATKASAPTGGAVEAFTGVRTMQPPSGNWLTPMHATAAATLQVTGNKKTMFLLPIGVAAKTSFKNIGCFVTVKAEGTAFVFRMGLYADDGTGAKPTGEPLLDAGTVSAEATGERSIAINQTLEPGRYWLAWVMQGTTLTVFPTISTCTSSSRSLGMKNLEPNNYGCLKQTTEVAGPLPAIGTLEPAATNPLIGLQVK